MLSEAQRRVGRWVTDYFGVENMALPERAARVLEEAVELAQAEGVSQDMARRMVDAVYAKDTGEPGQEAAGTMVCLLAWADASDQDLWVLTEREIERIHSKSVEHFRNRHRIKADAGIAAPAGRKALEETSDA